MGGDKHTAGTHTGRWGQTCRGHTGWRKTHCRVEGHTVWGGWGRTHTGGGGGHITRIVSSGPGAKDRSPGAGAHQDHEEEALIKALWELSPG